MDGSVAIATPVPLPSFLKHKSAFLTAMLIGAALRVYCVAFTNGTGDMDDWEDHAQQVLNRGLIGYYHANSFANHPPFISKVSALILQIATVTHVPFRILFRAPFALLDAGNALLLFSLLPENRWRFFGTACYWLSPTAILISAYHGNTDTAVASYFFLRSCQSRLGRKNIFVRFYSFSSRAGISRSPPCSLSRGYADIVRLLKRCARPLAWPTPFFLDLATIGRSNILPGLCPFGSSFAGGSPLQR